MVGPWFFCGLSVVFLCVETPRSNHKKTTVMSCFLTVTGSRKANHRRSTHTPHARATSHWPHTHNTHTTTQPHNHEATRTTPRFVTPRQHRPRKKQARLHQARPSGQGHFQFKENVVDARASPVAALLIQLEKGCDKGRGLVMDVRTAVEVAGTSGCGTVHEQDVKRHPRPSEVFASFSLGCSVLAAAASVTASCCSSNRESAALADAAVAAAGAAIVVTFAAVCCCRCCSCCCCPCCCRSLLWRMTMRSFQLWREPKGTASDWICDNTQGRWFNTVSHQAQDVFIVYTQHPSLLTTVSNTPPPSQLKCQDRRSS